MERVPPPFPAAAALAALDEVLMDTPLSPKHLHLSALGEKRAALFSVSKVLVILGHSPRCVEHSSSSLHSRHVLLRSGKRLYVPTRLINAIVYG